MLTYAGKRILMLLPALFILLWTGFYLSTCIPGDPTDRILGIKEDQAKGKEYENIEQQKERLRQQLGLHLPLFYVQLQSALIPSDLNTLIPSHAINPSTDSGFTCAEQNEIITWMHHYHEIQHAAIYLISLREIRQALIQCPELTSSLPFRISDLKDPDKMKKEITTIQKYLQPTDYPEKEQPFRKALEQSLQLYENLQQTPSSFRYYIPSIQWNGKTNRFHYWLFGSSAHQKGLIRGDFGVSWRNGQNIGDILFPGLWRTLLLCLAGLFISTCLAIPIAIRTSQYISQRKIQFTETFNLFLFNLPAYLVGLIGLYLFANPDIFGILPASGLEPIRENTASPSFWANLTEQIPYYILPLICYTHTCFSTIYAWSSSAIRTELHQPYIQAVRAKGLSEKKILYKHVLPNSSIPILTQLFQLIPYCFGGSILLERLFHIPGIGHCTLEAISAQDYPVLIAIILCSGLATLLMQVLCDITLAFINPLFSDRLQHA